MRVLGYSDESSLFAARLQSLGFIRGARVEFLRQAPLGDPIQLRVRGTRVALRRSEADILLLEPDT